MDYFKLLDQLDLHKLEEEVKEEQKNISQRETQLVCCDNQEIQISNHTYVCISCGIIQKTDYETVIDYKNPQEKIDVFNPNKSMNTWVGYIGSNNKYKSLNRINKWMNYSSQDVEANNCYKLIKNMILLIIPNLKENCCLGEKILNQAKLYWKALYYTDIPNAVDYSKGKPRPKSTRGEPRKCLFAFCIIRSLENYKINFVLLDTLKKILILPNMKPKEKRNIIEKYNKVLLTKIKGEDKTFHHREFNKYLEIINKYEPHINLDILTERYNINMKNKISKSKLEKKYKININPSSLLKAISYSYIKNHLTKQEACDKVLIISFLTLNKALKLII